MILAPVLEFARQTIRAAVTQGGAAVDATVGNGHDTTFLARTVGSGGHVLGIDIQAEALDRARERLQHAGVSERVTLLQAGHERLAALVKERGNVPVQGVMFNLGYLPGGDKTVVTRPATTVQALQGACDVLAPGGVVTIVLYTGHPGGQEEAEAVEAWTAALDQRAFHVLSYRYVNQRNAPPRLLVIEKRS